MAYIAQLKIAGKMENCAELCIRFYDVEYTGRLNVNINNDAQDLHASGIKQA